MLLLARSTYAITCSRQFCTTRAASNYTTTFSCDNEINRGTLLVFSSNFHALSLLFYSFKSPQ
jgi:hypothetical protein